ncbi:hypothetical protein X534_gp07 [Ralstonia phage RSB3]|uniref:Uncharacterized protein n=1 Tax=Ralstonia phage RSB3 TaxID=1402875 RepID=U3TK62_9CAUD|nr:hypothetical protein X534_gp07 [Ralstonia phage RSB3]BAN92318.1 hypothetical protein [Ralstonia phage RSB3]
MPKTVLGTFTSRKIEQEMVDAVWYMRDWKGDNTEVVKVEDMHGVRMNVLLHGNHIATWWPRTNTHTCGKLEVNEVTLRIWPSNTTISRLRALGADIRVDRGTVLLDNIGVAER